MGLKPRVRTLRLLALAVAFAGTCVLSGCSSSDPTTPTKKQGFDFQQNDSVLPTPATQDPNRVPVEQPKPQKPKQLDS
jgi:hypothetical protein